MSKKVKRTISVIIAAIMLLSTMSVLAFADLPTYPEATSKETVPHEHVAAYNADGTVKETLAEYVQPTCVKEGSKEYFVKCTICGKEIPGTRRKVTVDVLESHHQAGSVLRIPAADSDPAGPHLVTPFVRDINVALRPSTVNLYLYRVCCASFR